MPRLPSRSTSVPVPTSPFRSVPHRAGPSPAPTVPAPTSPAPSPPAPPGSQELRRLPRPGQRIRPRRPRRQPRPSPGTASPRNGSRNRRLAGTRYGTGGTPAGRPLAPATGTAGSPAPAAGSSQPQPPPNPVRGRQPVRGDHGPVGGAGLRGRSAAGVAGGVWGSAQLAGPNNMATISSPYTRGPAESAVMGVSRNGTIEPQVWWGAGLLALAGAAGVAAVRIRRSL